MSGIVAFLPCRAGSQRVPLKNTRPFAGNPGGLLAIKLEQLSATGSIDRVVVSTNDPQVIRIAEEHRARNDKIEIDLRPDHLCSSETSTDAVVTYASELFDQEHVLWTHVTSPMVDERIYASMISAYEAAFEAGTHDSLMTVTTLRTFLWRDSGAMNYDRRKEKWPRTQTLEPVYVVNSAAFLMAAPLMRQMQDRVGDRPVLFEIDEIAAFEVDWEEQFHIAEKIFLSFR